VRIDRRSILKSLTALSAGALLDVAPATAQAPAVASQPDWTTFQSGDFLWPAKPDAIIVRSLAGAAPQPRGPSEAEIEWTRERNALVAELRAAADPALRARADVLAAMTFQQFRAQYFENVQAGGERTRALGGTLGRLAVGHIAVLEVDGDGAPWVIEATPARTNRRYDVAYTRFPKGVIHTSYDDWIEEHADYRVWHGRLRDKAADERAKVAALARGFVDRDYWFWSLNLADEGSFYCSKLAWLCASRALGNPLDGEPQTNRSFWVTPKGIMGLKSVQMLHVPGTYGGGG
jgi:hypothetical protein